ncbi:MAG: LamG domain-containing protein, partial [Elusimicrobia bacterium]|nr:LamG domain-containing protein [Elusimicrobiota bacterium]
VSSNSATGTFTNGPLWVPGPSGKALKFDGSNDYVTVPNYAAINSPTNITVQAWVKTNNTDQTDAIIASKHVGGNESWALALDNGGSTITFHTDGQPGNIISASNVVVADGRWHHIAATRDSSNDKIYLDGTLLFTKSATAFQNNNNPINIGGSPNDGNYFNGYIDEVKVMNIALADNDVATEYRRSRYFIHEVKVSTNGSNGPFASVAGASIAVTGVDGSTTTQDLTAELGSALTLSTGTNNRVQIIIKDLAGNTTSNIYVVNVDTVEPTAPTSPGAISPQARDLRVSWTNGADSVSGLHATATAVELSTVGVGGLFLSSSGWISSTLSSYTFSNLTGNATYYAQILHRDAALNVSARASSSVFVAPGVHAVFTDTAPATIAQADTKAFLKIRLWTETGTTSYFSGITVNHFGNSPSNAITDASIWYDTDDNGYWTSDGDVRIGNLASMLNSSATVTINAGQSQADLNTSTKTFFLTAKAAPSSYPNNSIALRIAEVGSFSFFANARLRTDNTLPFSSTVSTVSDTASIISVISTATLAPAETYTGETGVALIKFRASVNNGTAEISSITLQRTGDSTDSDILSVNIFRDTGDGNFTLGTDILLGSDQSFISGIATYNVTHAQQSTRTITSGTPADFFVVVDVAAGASNGKTLGVKISTTTSFLWKGASDVTASSATIPIASSSTVIRAAIPSVTSKKSSSTWYGDPFFEFTGNQGSQNVDYIRWVWDQNATKSWSFDEGTQWTSGVLTTTANASGSWYLHVQGYKSSPNTQGGAKDYGPYYIDMTAPVSSNVQCLKKDGVTYISCSGSVDISTPTIRESIQDSNSGLAIGHQPLSVTSGTVLYLNFEEWPPVDKSGYNQVVITTATVGQPGPTLAVSTGRFNGGMSIPPAGNQGGLLVSTMSQLANATAVTVETWFQYATNENFCPAYLFAFQTHATRSLYASLNQTQTSCSGANGIGGGLQAGYSTDVALSSEPHTSINTWYYLAVTFNDATNKGTVYLNGREISTGTFDDTETLLRYLYIGTYNTGAPGYYVQWGPRGGIMDEFRVTARLLSADEIAANYFSGARKFTRDGGATWIYDPSTYTKTGAVGVNATNGTTVVQTATGTVNFWNAHASNNQFAYLFRDQVGNVYQTATTVNIPYAAPTFTSIQAEAKDNDGYTASESGGILTVNDLTPNIRFTATSQGPAALRISSAPVSISSDTVLFLDFEEWPPLDKSGHGNHPTQIKGNAQQTGSGHNAGGLALDGSGDYLVIPPNPDFYSLSFTASFWFKGPTASGNQYSFGQYNGANATFILALAIDVLGNTPGFYHQGAWIGGTSKADNNTWHLIAGVYDPNATGARNRIYLDGVLQATGDTALGLNPVSTIYIGCNYSGAACTNGVLDEIKFVKRAMSSQEIALEYYSGLYKFSDDGGTTWMSHVSSNPWVPLVLSSSKTSWGNEVAVSSQVHFFQESDSSSGDLNKVRFLVMDSIGNIHQSSDYTV